MVWTQHSSQGDDRVASSSNTEDKDADWHSAPSRVLYRAGRPLLRGLLREEQEAHLHEVSVVVPLLVHLSERSPVPVVAIRWTRWRCDGRGGDAMEAMEALRQMLQLILMAVPM